MTPDLELRQRQARGLVGRARAGLIMGSPFFGSLVVRANCRVDETLDPCKPACTDGKDIFYRSDYIKEIGVGGTTALVLHEILHCALGHLWRRGERDADRWNVACDHVVNLTIKAARLRIAGNVIEPRADWLCDVRYAGLTAEQVYARLPDDAGRGGVGTCDDHSRWETGQGKAGAAPDAVAAAAAWRGAVAQARATAKKYGILPAAIDQAIDGVLAPPMPWRALLAQFMQTSVVQTDYSFARSWQVAVPGLAGVAILPRLGVEGGEIVLAVDASGSVDDHAYAVAVAAIRDLLALVPEVAVRVVVFDTEVQAVFDLADGDELPNRRPCDGGTNFAPVFEFVAAKRDEGLWAPQAIVFLTDLYGEFPKEEPELPVLWLSTEGDHAPFGQVVEFARDES